MRKAVGRCCSADPTPHHVIKVLQNPLPEADLRPTLFAMMRKIRVLQAAVLSTGLITGAAQALSVHDDPLSLFASCAGRLEAEVSFADNWNRSPPNRAQHQQAQFEDLIAAVVLPETSEATQDQRIAAKMRHIALLWRATFEFEARAAEQAARMAARDVAMCGRLLMG